MICNLDTWFRGDRPQHEPEAQFGAAVRQEGASGEEVRRGRSSKGRGFGTQASAFGKANFLRCVIGGVDADCSDLFFILFLKRSTPFLFLLHLPTSININRHTGPRLAAVYLLCNVYGGITDRTVSFPNSTCRAPCVAL